MFVLMVGELIISFVLYVISKLALLEKLNSISSHMLKQGFLTILMFNIFNLSFSAGAHLKFAQYNETAYIEGVALIVVSVLLCVMAGLVFLLSS